MLSGLLTAADLRNGPAEACTLRAGQGRAPDYPDIGDEETALSDAQRASLQKVQLELSIAPDCILDLLGSAGSIQIRCRMPEPLVALWRS